MSHSQAWTHFLAASLTHEKLNGQPLEVLMGLWKQLHPDHRCRPLPPKRVEASAVVDQELLPCALTSSLT